MVLVRRHRASPAVSTGLTLRLVPTPSAMLEERFPRARGAGEAGAP